MASGAPEGGLGWLCPAVQGSKFEVQGSRFGAQHKRSEYNPPLPPPSGWSGGTLLPPWTYPGTIDPMPNPILDQAGLSESASCDSSAGQRRRGLEVGDSMFDGGYPVFPARRTRFAVGLRCPAPLSNA